VELNLNPPNPQRISVSPPGRGWRARPEVTVNTDYVRTLLEQSRLTERDETLLKWLDELPVLSSRQIKRLFWPDTSVSNMHRRLRALYDYHLLDRVRMLNKTEGITYTLGKAGRLWLYGEQRGGNPPRINLNQLAHDLTIAEVAMLFVEDLRLLNHSEQRISLNWVGEKKARIVHRDKVIIEPDSRVCITVNGEGSQLFFIEIDRGTERAAAFSAKIRRYHEANKEPGLKGETDQNPIIMVVTNTPERVQKLAELIASSNNHLVWALQYLDNLKENGIYHKQRWTMVKKDKILSRSFQ